MHMSLLCLATVLCVGLAAAAVWPDLEPLSVAQINYINSVPGNTWTAGRNFDTKDLPYVKSLLGVNIAANIEYNKYNLYYIDGDTTVEDLPTNFDSRQKWPNCSTIAEVRDQGECGSCWAFGSVEAMSDRICVATGKNVHISAEDLTSCCELCGFGCNGGFPSIAWEYYVREGIVTGGVYGSNKGCLPYTLPPCDHHVSGHLRNCSKTIRPTPRCTRQCIQGYAKSYREDKHHGQTSYGIHGVNKIMNEIYTNGPVTSSFTVYSDFPTYKSGVYRHVQGSNLGGHSIKIIGWGVEKGVDYWLVTNSWNTDWGEKGFFKILRGSDECGIESGIVAGTPKA